MTTACPSREGRYVPWTLGEVFECLTCGARVCQDHTVGPVRGRDYDAVYPIPEHVTERA
jgi:hypothetical protein